MTPEPEKKEQTCTENCSTCAPAQPHSAPTGLPPKATIDVQHVILVLSGKGGVGKSTVSVNLAYALASHGKKVGLLDLDFHGPIIPKLLGIEDQRPTVLANTIEPVHVTGNLAVMS
ncbi:MAG: P-loop NTPase, partial [Roseiarcus sp.]